MHPPKPNRQIIVIGAGPAGMMAAGQAAINGARVIILEKMKQTGRKLAITGKGRCNITNIAPKRDFIAHFGKTGKFLHQAFSHFFNNELLDFLEDRQLGLVKERGGRVFPACGKATKVNQVLLEWLQENSVIIKKNAQVDELIIRDGEAKGVICRGKKHYSDAVILTTGGVSYPQTGSSGDGHRLAKDAGHKIINIRPALIPLLTAGDTATQLHGLGLRNIRVSLYVDNKKRNEAFGEMDFVKFGVSGPVILTLSGEIVEHLQADRKIELAIDLKPALDEKKLDTRLLRDLQKRHNEHLDSLLRGLLPRQMIPVCLAQTDIPAQRLAGMLTARERRRLKTWLKDFRLQITGHRPIREAIVTAGGIDTGEINPRSMESRLVKNLYFAGEVIDIQADTGGYNLQAAFSTGWLAGTAAAK